MTAPFAAAAAAATTIFSINTVDARAEMHTAVRVRVRVRVHARAEMLHTVLRGRELEQSNGLRLPASQRLVGLAVGAAGVGTRVRGSGLEPYPDAARGRGGGGVNGLDFYLPAGGSRGGGRVRDKVWV